MDRNQWSTVLLVRVCSAVFALPLSQVIETMRPLPVSPLSGEASLVCGVALIRGIPTPVVALAALFQSDQQDASGRFVTLRSGERAIALSVETVIGVAELADAEVTSMPPLLRNARTEAIEAIGCLDAELLVMLQTAKLVPESIWKSIAARGAAQ